jgi:hypothetical protein
MKTRRLGRGIRTLAIALSGAIIALGLLGTPVLAAGRLDITTLSNRPDKLSGGDVLVKVTVPSGTALSDVTVALNRSDITGQFWQDTAAHALVGLVTGLEIGTNRLEAKARGASADRLDLRNYPLAGPIFSGPHQQPFFCQTHQFRPFGAASPLLTATQIDDPCMIPMRVDYVYRTTGNQFVALPSGPPPANMATTMTGQPYIVRLETGTINRAIYQIAILDNPGVPGPDLRNHGDPGWNGRLVYTFGGGCGGGHYRQGTGNGVVLNDVMLTRGFAVASSSLNVLGTNCNDVTSGETMMMVKERFIEAFGVPRYTMGYGCSGGAIQQYMIANNFPGLLDGLLPQCSFPDQWGNGTFDARLLLNYFVNNQGVPWTQAELTAASGFGTFGQIYTQGTSWAARIDPFPVRPPSLLAVPGFPENQLSYLYNNVVPQDVRYDPAANPDGARATTWDHNVNTLGRDANGFARRPLDNTGIQYGLAALNAGQITVEQFLDLNEKIGGMDVDGHFVARRMVADRRATLAVYETGKVIDGSALVNVPILDVDVIYTDTSAAGDVHLKYNHFAVRERLIRSNGNADNMVIWSGVFGPRSGILTEAFVRMAAWLDAITADTSGRPQAEKVVANKPANVTDGCWTGTTAVPTFIAEEQFLGGPGTSPCNTLYPGFGFPRLSAGAPLTNDVLKCRLKRVDLGDYEVTFTAQERSRLYRIFPDGVCDYSRAGVDQRDVLDTWLTYPAVGKYKSE